MMFVARLRFFVMILPSTPPVQRTFCQTRAMFSSVIPQGRAFSLSRAS